MALMFANKKQIRQETEQHTMNINMGSITITIITYGIATHAPTTTMAITILIVTGYGAHTSNNGYGTVNGNNEKNCKN